KGARLRETLSRHIPIEGRLEIVLANLSSDDGWEDAVRGCRYVLHVASPFPPGLPKHEDDLIAPARDGTLRVLRSASAAGVARAAVVYGHPRDGSRTYDEQSWSNLSAEIGPYEKSKTIAERAAWDFVSALPEGPHPRLELVTVNPGVVLGPVLDKDHGTSAEV